MNELKKTLSELKKTLNEENLLFIVTRFNRYYDHNPDDIDILVREADFDDVIISLEKEGYASSSHDHALGGRIPGAQKNLTKKARVKIDLHKDFTWRGVQYFDLSNVWNSFRNTQISGISVKVPEVTLDAFIVLINVIFEKTYFMEDEYIIVQKQKDKLFVDNTYYDQAKQYGWGNTFLAFKSWFRNERDSSLPLFLPTRIILLSYFEKFLHDKKFHIISFLYYFFFRTRYFINKTLPYDS